VTPADDEHVREAKSPGFGDAVSVAWADPEQELFGSARIGLASNAPGSASGLALLFHGTEAVAVAAAREEGNAADDWRRVTVGAVTLETITPGESWRALLDTEEGGFELELDRCGPAVELAPETAEVARATGLEGYDHACTVRGSVRVGPRRFDVECLGQRGRQWGVADWKHNELGRTVSAWFEPGRAVMLVTVRPAGEGGHASEAITANLLEPEGGPEMDEPGVIAVADPRLSTTYDAAGRQRRAGLELWRDEEDGFARRLAGEAVCGTSIELGRLRLDAAFFRWRMEGRTGSGRYDVLRRV
jgi:hypothetical protein